MHRSQYMQRKGKQKNYAVPYNGYIHWSRRQFRSVVSRGRRQFQYEINSFLLNFHHLKTCKLVITKLKHYTVYLVELLVLTDGTVTVILQQFKVYCYLLHQMWMINTQFLAIHWAT